MARKEEEQTSNAAPMEYVRVRLPNLDAERARLAQEAENLKRADLDERAAAVGLDTSGAATKADAVETVTKAARPPRNT